jgi:hypothetical protein
LSHETAPRRVWQQERHDAGVVLEQIEKVVVQDKKCRPRLQLLAQSSGGFGRGDRPWRRNPLIAVRLCKQRLRWTQVRCRASLGQTKKRRDPPWLLRLRQD